MKKLTLAKTLDEVYQTVWPEPLLTEDEFNAFYRDEINKVRGDDKVDRMKLNLQWAYQGVLYKCFLMGHSGVGKSTELTRLIQSPEVCERFRAVRFSVMKSLDPGSFKPFDVLLLMMMLVVEETAKPIAEGGAGRSIPDDLLRRILDWLSDHEITRKETTEGGGQAVAGIGPAPGGFLSKALGLFATVKGEIKYAAGREQKIVEYRLRLVSDLIRLLNEVLDKCNALLMETSKREWLFIGEDFDKSGIPDSLNEDLFLKYGNIFQDLRAHLIFNIPITLVYSARMPQLPFASDRIHCIPDTPVYGPDHQPRADGRKAVRDILEARLDPKLFEAGQMERLIVASGGNLRDLFALVNQAAVTAILAKSKTIGPTDVDKAVWGLRTDYERRLGEGPFDVEKVKYPEKADRLVKIYNQDQAAKIPDPILHSLLRARAVQEFNGERWFGVHPLVVDLLKAQGKLVGDEKGIVLGGTN